MLIFERVVVDAGGALRGPSSRAFWSEVFSSADLPAAGGRLRNAQDEGSIERGMAHRGSSTPKEDGAANGWTKLLGLRAFAGVDDTQLPDVLVAVRAFPRYRMPDAHLERWASLSPRPHAAAGRKRRPPVARRLGSVALTQFQGAR
jgi:hypothetical protein